jgi:hypothetical protein
MKKITTINKLGWGIAAFCGNVTNLWAAEGAPEDSSNFFVWIFLAFCALIFVAQLIPAMMVLLGFARGVKKEKAQVPPQSVDDLTSPEG